MPTPLARPVLLALPALLLAPLAGCFLSRSTAHEPLRPAAVAHLEPGVTTAAEVVQALGAPVEVVQLGRRSAYRYDYVLSKRAGLFLLVVTLLNSDTHSDRVWVFFDEQDVLSHVGATFAADQAEYALPWSD